MIQITGFYHFVPFPDYAAHREPLLALCEAQGVKGIILLTAEGVNSTLSGSQEGVYAVLAYLRALPGFEGLEARHYKGEYQPFQRIKVRLKKETITLKQPINVSNPPESYVTPQAWDALIAREDVVVVDTRNSYEIEAGTFKNAINPQIDHFSEFPGWVEQHLDPQKQPKIAMFCTGGIRCEKAVSYMKSKGFSEVYQLHGGILNYFAETKNKNDQWDGACFVFDERVAVDDRLQPAAAWCRTCQLPIPLEQLRDGLCPQGHSCDKAPHLDQDVA